MKMLVLFALSLLILMQVDAVYAQIRKAPFIFPATDQYLVLKADFHQHTVFSDGSVWPATRVEEAYGEDLDVIALTEHIEYRPHLDEMTARSHSHSFELAVNAAERFGIILIRGTEITRMMPPGHLNAINITDADVFEKFVNPNNSSDSAHVVEALAEARRQGGFVFWNHTAFPTPDNKSTWHPIHQHLLEQGLMMGIEVVNGERYEPIAFQWCLDHNLTIFSNTDVHSTMAQKRSADDSKVMTLVLAKERTQDGVMEALRDRRTIALWNNQLMGREQHVAPVVAGAVKARLHERNNLYLFELENASGFPFIFEFTDLPQGFRIRNDVPWSVKPYETTAFTASVRGDAPQSVKVRVLNVFVTPENNLEMELPVIK
ncbi:MAG: histidinol-phosphatase [Tannerella sp.]|jgi:hypothetical protein|nr:histidinol-phosphatase [Tannerella sp.]